MIARRTKRMHTVPQSYLEAFAVDDPTRRGTAGVWRFDRLSGEAKIVGVRDSEVVKDIYTVYADDGTPDIGIESELLCGIEAPFNTARKFLLEQNVISRQVALSKEQWAAIARFIAGCFRSSIVGEITISVLATKGYSRIYC
jgi:hypothetical protein